MDYSPEEITLILNGSDDEKIGSVVREVTDDARSGDARANYMLAKWYGEGLFGLEKSKKKYNYHMKAAIEKLLPEAVYDYGVSLDGRSPSKTKRALGYYILGAVLDDVDAIEALIDYFIYGSVLEKNDFVAAALRMRKDYLVARK